jgi:L-ascorbate metabolism protein UlaG (beta-lactamase superfamily)
MLRPNPYYSGPASDHFDGTRFFNPRQPTTDRSIGELIRWQLGGGKAKWPRTVPVNTATVAPRVSALVVTMVGHASVLIQLHGRNILVDPVWSERASPVTWAGPKRVTRPGIAFDELPPIDAVLVTHNHYDHMDVETLRRLHAAHRPLIVTPLGNDVIVRRAVPGVGVVALDWHHSCALASGIHVTAVPAHHWSARGRGDRRMALWSGFVIQSPNHLIYNVGDTAYGDGDIFRDVRARFGGPDLAIIPIGAYEPRWFMSDGHVNPEEAVRMMLDCGAAQALGVHWGTFQLTDESRDDPKGALAVALQARGLPPERFLAVEPGEVWRRPAALDFEEGSG